MKMEVEIRMAYLPINQGMSWLPARSPQRGMGHILPWSVQKEPTLLTF